MPKKSKQEIALGNKVKDVVTGFTGIAAAKIEYLKRAKCLILIISMFSNWNMWAKA